MDCADGLFIIMILIFRYDIIEALILGYTYRDCRFFLNFPCGFRRVF